MHELGLSRNIVAIVSDHAAGRKVKLVRVSIGPLACVERQALAFCWDIVTDNTPLAGAELAFVEADDDTFLIKDFEVVEAA
jgi:hydrogenase nickel incorporation protein HypA/HybF